MHVCVFKITHVIIILLFTIIFFNSTHRAAECRRVDTYSTINDTSDEITITTLRLTLGEQVRFSLKSRRKQKLVAQRLAVSFRKPGKDVPTIEVSKKFFLPHLQWKFLLAKAGESINN